MTDTACTTYRPSNRTGLLYSASTFARAYWWAQAVARTYARTNDVRRSVSETEQIV